MFTMFASEFETMNIENTQSQMRKGILEYCILAVIRRGEAYPSDLIAELRGSGLPILEGTLYPLLDRKSTRLNSSHEWISRMPSSA